MLETKKTILLVEDEVLIAMLEKQQLEKEGYRVFHSSSGEKAIDLISENKEPIDLILMDIDLGKKMDGTEAAQEILRLHDIPILFLSSHIEKEIVEKTEKITNYGYVVKNSSFTVLDASIKMAFKLFESKIREKESKNILIHSHDMMSYIIEHSRSAIAVQDKDLNYIYVSKRYLKEYNVKNKDIIGKHHYDVFPDLPQKWRDIHQKVLAGEVVSAEDDPYEREDGSVDWTCWECRPWYEEDGSIGGLIIYNEVITDRKLAEEKEKESIKNIEFLSTTAMQFVEFPDDKNIYDYIGEQLRKIVGNDPYIILNSIDVETSISTIRVVLGLGKLTEKLIKLMGRHPVGMTISVEDSNSFYTDGKVHLYEEGIYKLLAKTVPKNICNSIEKLLNIKEVYIIELVKHERFFGSIIILLKNDSGELKNKQLIETFIKQASIAVQKKQAEETLHENEERFRLLAENSTDMISRHSPDGIYLYVSAACERLLGYSSEEMIGHSTFEFIEPEDIPNVEQSLMTILEQQAVSTTVFRIRCKDGQLVWLETTSHTIRDPQTEEAIEIHAATRDITERKLAEEERELNNNDLLFLNTIAFKLVQLTHTERIEEFLPKQIMEYSTAEVAVFSLYDPDKHALITKHIEADQYFLKKIVELAGNKILETESPVSTLMYTMIIDRVIYCSNTLAEVSFGAIPVSISKAIQIITGIDRFYAIAHVIDGDLFGTTLLGYKKGKSAPREDLLKSFTHLCAVSLKRMRVEKKLKANEERLSLAMSAGDMGIWDLDIVTNKMTWDSQMFSLYGVTKESFNATYETWKACIHPADVQEVNKKHHMALCGEKDFDTEYRLIWPDGTIRVIHASAKVYFGDSGQPLRMIGTNLDITESKLLEDELLQSENRFRRLTENARDMIYRMSLPDGVYEYVSPASTDIFGYTPEEFINTPLLIKEAIHADWRDYFKEKWGLLLAGEFSPTYEYQIVHGKSGETRWLNQRNVLIKNNEGQTVAIEGIVTDISERKIAEEKIKNLLLEKELILKEVHHRIKNNMNVMSSLFKLQSNAQVSSETKVILRDAVGRLETMMVLYDKLYRSNNFEKLSLKEYFPSLIQEIVGIFPQSVKIKAEIEDIMIDADLLTSLGIILNELITNSMKYAFKNDEDDLISVTAVKNDTIVSIIYGDNGIGIPESITLEESLGFGMHLLKKLVERNRQFYRPVNGIRFTSVLSQFQGSSFSNSSSDLSSGVCSKIHLR